LVGINAALRLPRNSGFQCRLGFRRAIVILEDDCAEFSNIHSLGQIRFPWGNISSRFEQVRRVLERESVIVPS
jgi:hypothetical protein